MKANNTRNSRAKSRESNSQAIPDLLGHNRLARLADDIRTAHADIEKGSLHVATRVLDAGKALIEAKSALPHGKWLPWLDTNTGLSGRTARRYMQIAESGLELATVANLGIVGATAQLGRRTRKTADMIGFESWQDDLIKTLDDADKACPGFRAGFVAWAKSRRIAERYEETLRQNCPKDELAGLDAMIAAEQNRTLAIALRRAHVATGTTNNPHH